MNLKMRGTAAFIGVLGPMPRRLSDIFEVADLVQMRKVYAESLRQPRSYLPRRKKDRDDDEEK
jgi:hypothetical protein